MLAHLLLTFQHRAGVSSYKMSIRDRVGVLVELAVGHGTRQHTARYIENFQYLVVPVQCVDVEHHRPAGVGVVGHVDLAAGQLPDEPRLHQMCIRDRIYSSHTVAAFML